MAVHCAAIILIIPLLQLITLQNKAVRIMNDAPLQDNHNTPHYVNLSLLHV